MDGWILSRATGKPLTHVDVQSYELVLASASADTGKAVVAGQMAESYAGHWLYCLDKLWLIGKVKPTQERTTLTLAPPESLFQRRIPYTPPADGESIGHWLSAQIAVHYINQPDTAYAVPYLDVSNSDTSPFRAPAQDKDGLICLTDYMLQSALLDGLRWSVQLRSRRVQLSLATMASKRHNLPLDDGHSALVSMTMGSTGVAKVTARQPDADGVIQTTDWYLSAAGDISTQVPAERATGEWITLSLQAKDDQAAKVREAIAKQSYQHKVELVSDRQMQLFDRCHLALPSGVTETMITGIRLTDADKRYHYTGGNLKITATDKLKGVIK